MTMLQTPFAQAPDQTQAAAPQNDRDGCLPDGKLHDKAFKGAVFIESVVRRSAFSGKPPASGTTDLSRVGHGCQRYSG